ncbi:MAG: glycosyltransferase family 4 protein [Bacteroidales bacterium]|nr:glycosyltransferase family 4 protein [Candidatus Latescibacterota bacterium]
MRILMVLKRFHPDSLFGGAERSAIRLASKLVSSGLRIEFCGARMNRDWKQREKIITGDGPILVRRLPHPHLRFLGTLVYNISLFFNILQGRKRYDAVHIHFASVEMMTAALARMMGGPPVICKVACSGRAGEISIAKKRFYYPLFCRLMRRIDAFVALSEEIADELAAEGIIRSRIIRIPNGLDPQSFTAPSPGEKQAARNILDIKSDARVILFTGRLSPQKNLDILLESLPLDQSSLLMLIAGQGPERQRLESLAMRLGLDKTVRFLGPVEEVSTLYHAADIFVLPSRDEGLSNSLLEAMSSGLHVIASDVSGSSEVIEDGVSGILFPAYDRSSLNSAILEALSNSAPHMGEQARQKISADFSLVSVSDRYIELYSTLSHRWEQPESEDPEPAEEIAEHHKRPLFLINSFPPRIGGAERLVESLAAEFSRNGVSNTVVTRLSGEASLVEKRDRTLIIRIPVFGSRALRSLLFRSVSIAVLLALHRRFDCLHVHSLDAPAVIGLLYRRLTGRDLFVTIHNTGKVEALRKRFNGKRNFSRIIEESRSIVSINRTIADDLLESGCPAEKISPIPNGVDTEQFSPLDPDERYRGLSNMGILGRTIFLFVGNFHDQKGIDTLIRGWKILSERYPDSGAMLFLVGNGILFDEMKDLASSLEIDDTIVFLGRRSDVAGYLRLVDVFVQPSRWEGLSIAMLEAMSCGLPMIGTPVGGAAEIIKDRENGLLVPVDDEEALSTAMGRLLEDTILRKTLGSMARNTVKIGYSMKKCARAHMAMFDGTLSKGEDNETGKTEEGDTTSDKRDKQAPEQEIEGLSRQLS